MEDREVTSTPRQGDGSDASVGRTAPGWRTVAVSVAVAVVLSVTATILLGGASRLTGWGGGGFPACETGSVCCPTGAAGDRAR